MAQNINDIVEELLNLARAGQLTDEALRELTEQALDTTDSFDKFGNGLVETAKIAHSFGKEMLTGSQSANTMSTTIGSLSNALGDAIPMIGGFISGIGAATAYGVKRLEASYDAFQSLADVGIIGAGGISELVDQFTQANIPLTMYSNMLKKNAKDLAFVYGTSIKGAKEFSETLSNAKDSDLMRMRNLGYTIEEMGDAVIDFQKRNLFMGFQSELSQSQLKKATADYAVELSVLSALTGKTASAMRAERDELLIDPVYQSVIRGLSKPIQDGLEEGYLLLKGQNEDAAKAFKASLTGYYNNEVAQQAYRTGLHKVNQQYLADTKAANGNRELQDQALVDLQNGQIDAAKNTLDKWGDMPAYAQKRAQELFGDMGQLNALAKREKITMEQFQKERQSKIDASNATDALTKNFASFNQVMAQLETSFDKLIINKDTMTQITSLFESTVQNMDSALKWLSADDKFAGSLAKITEFGDRLIKIVERIEQILFIDAPPPEAATTKSSTASLEKLNVDLKSASVDYNTEIQDDQNKVTALSTSIEEKEAKVKDVNAQKSILGDPSKNRELMDQANQLKIEIAQEKVELEEIKAKTAPSFYKEMQTAMDDIPWLKASFGGTIVDMLVKQEETSFKEFFESQIPRSSRNAMSEWSQSDQLDEVIKAIGIDNPNQTMTKKQIELMNQVLEKGIWTGDNTLGEDDKNFIITSVRDHMSDDLINALGGVMNASIVDENKTVQDTQTFLNQFMSDLVQQPQDNLLNNKSDTDIDALTSVLSTELNNFSDITNIMQFSDAMNSVEKSFLSGAKTSESLFTKLLAGYEKSPDQIVTALTPIVAEINKNNSQLVADLVSGNAENVKKHATVSTEISQSVADLAMEKKQPPIIAPKFSTEDDSVKNMEKDGIAENKKQQTELLVEQNKKMDMLNETIKRGNESMIVSFDNFLKEQSNANRLSTERNSLIGRNNLNNNNSY